MTRIVYLDIMKGLAIWLVVIGHLIQYNGEDGWIHNKVYEWIYSFHMPLFFIISGYLCSITSHIVNYKDFFVFVLKKIRALIIPLVVWSLIMWRFLFFEDLSSRGILCLVDMFAERGLWFLKYLFFESAIYGVIQLFVISTKDHSKMMIREMLFTILLFFSIFSLSEIFHSASLRSLCLFYLFFMGGAIWAKYFRFKSIIDSHTVIIIAFLIFVSFSWQCCTSGNLYDDFVKCLVSPCAFIIFSFLCKKMAPFRVGTYIASVGRYSLVIYCFHWILLSWGATKWEMNNINSIILFVIVGVSALPVCLLCVLLGKIIERFSWSRLLLLGKK